MDLIFGWSRNYISLTSIESDNYVVFDEDNFVEEALTE
jgi:hypothetical protein